MQKGNIKLIEVGIKYNNFSIYENRNGELCEKILFLYETTMKSGFHEYYK